MSDFAQWAWHIEISSKCTLRCPRCPRAEHPENLINTELKLDFFKKNFPPLFVHKNVEKIMFCGNEGDPIYAHDLIPVVTYFKRIKPRIQITIITNGSYKKPSWWAELGQVLNPYDNVTFSIDGYDHASNQLYRVNSDWDSIMQGITTLRGNSTCRLIWSTIPFSFNQDRLEDIQQLAMNMGMDAFELSHSSKFGSAYLEQGVDPLEPRPELTSASVYRRHLIKFTPALASNPTLDNLIRNTKIKIKNNVKPLCVNGTGFGLYIDARGRFFPCCFVGTRYPHNKEWQDFGNGFNLNTKSVDDVLNDEFWDEDFQSYRWQECQTTCAN
jgi:MoaA/NifB/PqqE/SkfB family radical SAM enzyme